MYLLAVTAANHPFHKISPPPDGRGHTLLYCFSHLPKPQRRGFAGFGTLCRHNLQRLPGFIGPVPPPLLMRTQFQFNRPALICQTWTGRLLHLFPGVGGHDILRKLADSLPDRVLPHPGYLRITGGRQIPGSGPAVRGPPLPWVAEDLLALAGGLSGDAHRRDIRVVRGPLAKPRVYGVNLKKLVEGSGPDIVLAPGDIIFVTRTGVANVRDALGAIGPILVAGGMFGSNVGAIMVTQ